jgi:hypothetical protein
MEPHSSQIFYCLQFVYIVHIIIIIIIIIIIDHVKCVLCHHGMARPQVADAGDGLQIWREAANILNKQSRTADKGWPSSLGAGRRDNNSSVVVCVFVKVVTFQPSRCLATIGGFVRIRCLATTGKIHRHRQQRDLISLPYFLA